MQTNEQPLLIDYRPDVKRSNNQKVEPAVVIALSNADFSTKEIAQEVDCTPSNVRRILKRYKIEQELMQDFKDNESDVQTGIKEKVALKLATSNVPIISALDFKNMSISYKAIFECNRLQENKSTANIAHKSSDLDPARLQILQDTIKKMYGQP